VVAPPPTWGEGGTLGGPTATAGGDAPSAVGGRDISRLGLRPKERGEDPVALFLDRRAMVAATTEGGTGTGTVVRRRRAPSFEVDSRAGGWRMSEPGGESPIGRGVAAPLVPPPAL
jgi:hypothetical protein